TALISLSRNSASKRCKVSTSGVVSEPPKLVLSGNTMPSVPMVAHGTPLAVSALANQVAQEVFPFVPVTAITKTCSDGCPYQVSPNSPSNCLKPGTPNTGTG